MKMKGALITDLFTGFEPLGRLGLADDMETDVECPVCGAGDGQQCGETDPNNAGLAIELGKYVHFERISS